MPNPCLSFWRSLQKGEECLLWLLKVQRTLPFTHGNEHGHPQFSFLSFSFFPLHFIPFDSTNMLSSHYVLWIVSHSSSHFISTNYSVFFLFFQKMRHTYFLVKPILYCVCFQPLTFRERKKKRTLVLEWSFLTWLKCCTQKQKAQVLFILN